MSASDRPALHGAQAERFAARRVAHIVLRVLLGVTLLATSVGKALDVPGFHDVMQKYDLFPVWTLWPVAFAMPVVEAFIATTMLTGWRLWRGIQASLLLHASFAAILSLELVRGLHLKNCGCFGVFWARPLTWLSPIEDLVMLAITLGVLLTLPSVYPRRPHEIVRVR